MCRVLPVRTQSDTHFDLDPNRYKVYLVQKHPSVSVDILLSHWIMSDEEAAGTLCYSGDHVILESQATTLAFQWAFRVLKMHMNYNFK